MGTGIMKREWARQEYIEAANLLRKLLIEVAGSAEMLLRSSDALSEAALVAIVIEIVQGHTVIYSVLPTSGVDSPTAFDSLGDEPCYGAPCDFGLQKMVAPCSKLKGKY